MSAKGLLPSLFDLILPQVCPVCDARITDPEFSIICPACHKGIRTVTPPYCPCCGLPYPSDASGGHLCAACIKGRRYFTLHRTCAIYDGTIKEAIHRFKYNGIRPLVHPFVDLMINVFKEMVVQFPVDLLVPVPLHKRRLRERGFNQALLLARELSKRSGILYDARTLIKVNDTAVQINLKKKERKKNLIGAFAITDRLAIEGRMVLLVDDVYTTGATLDECARTLRKGGAKGVAAITIARAP